MKGVENRDLHRLGVHESSAFTTIQILVLQNQLPQNERLQKYGVKILRRHVKTNDFRFATCFNVNSKDWCSTTVALSFLKKNKN